MNSAAAHLPPPVRDERGRAFAAAIDLSAALAPYLACPAKTRLAPDAVLLALAHQLGVAGPLWQAMPSRERREALIDSAPLLRRRRGTPWAVEEVMRLLGYADAKVLDRTWRLTYDGEAAHDGSYCFDGGRGTIRLAYYKGQMLHDGGRIFDGVMSYDPHDWTGYRIRLYMDEDSRAFAKADWAIATLMAETWAPLRETLAGWYARHMAATEVADPCAFADSVSHVQLMDGRGGAEGSDAWLHPGEPPKSMQGAQTWLQPLDGGAVAIRWKAMPGGLDIKEVHEIALIGKDGRALAALMMPPVWLGPNVTYEGYWAVKNETQ
jgi:hypothetical protein